MNVTLAGKSFPLHQPSGLASLDLRLSCPGLEPEQRGRMVRWAFGAVGMSWAGKKLGWPDLSACKHDVLAYGEQVYAGLVAEGLVKGDEDVKAVIDAAWEILGAASPQAEDVQSARDFSQPPSAGT